MKKVLIFVVHKYKYFILNGNRGKYNDFIAFLVLYINCHKKSPLDKGGG